jgi:hypothetical protein
MSSDSSSCSPHHQALLDQLAYAAPDHSPPGKRLSRASKRAPTTYISTDPCNFRLMVQHITGSQAEPASSQLAPGLDANNTNTLMTNHQQAEQQPCFPTLDSWNISSMYAATCFEVHLLLM